MLEELGHWVNELRAVLLKELQCLVQVLSDAESTTTLVLTVPCSPLIFLVCTGSRVAAELENHVKY